MDINGRQSQMEQGTSSQIALWAAEGEQHPSKKFTKRHNGRIGSAILFWVFLCLIVMVTAPDVIIWLLTIGG